MAVNKRYAANLLAFARGELSAEERAWMETYLAQNPDIHADTIVLKELFSALSGTASQEQDPVDGFAELQERLLKRQAENASKNRSSREASDAPDDTDGNTDKSPPPKPRTGARRKR